MKKRISIAVSVVALALLLIAGTVAVTVAYLTSTANVTNTFTVGKVAIDMDETDVDEYGVAIANADRVKANEYKLIPGKTYTKDPIVTVKADSEACWVFVKIENGLEAIEAAGNTAISAQMSANSWTALAGETGVWYKSVDAATAKTGTTLDTFATFTLADDADVSTYAGEQIIVTAYAIQAAELDTADAAWEALGN